MMISIVLKVARKNKFKFGSLIDGAGAVDRAIQSLVGQVVNYVHAQATAALAALGGEKRVEYFAQVFLRHAAAAVLVNNMGI